MYTDHRQPEVCAIYRRSGNRTVGYHEYPWSLDLGSERGLRVETRPCARRRGNREEANDEHPVVGPACPRRTYVRTVGRHEGLHVRQDTRGGPVLWRDAAGSLDGPWHPRTPDKGYSLTDFISMQTMRGEGIIEALTNDRHFEQEGFRALFRDS